MYEFYVKLKGEDYSMLVKVPSNDIQYFNQDGLINCIRVNTRTGEETSILVNTDEISFVREKKDENQPVDNSVDNS